MFNALSEAEYEELRNLILGLNNKELEKLKKWLSDPESFANEISDIVPISIRQLVERRIILPEAVLPLIEEAIEKSVAENPHKLANALYPVMVPAIRKAVTEDIKRILDTLNNSLENSFSPKRIGWRFKALASGRSYGEIVLSNAYLYRVRQVFLIHRKTGLLLQHVIDKEGDFKDPDMVSAMLTAINDFVHDSFSIDSESDIETIEVGGFTVWIEKGPYAIIAGIVEGNPPYELREVFKQSLENIHLDFVKYLMNFDGDVAPFEDDKRHLRLCLQSQEKEKKSKKPIGLIIIICLVFLGLAYWIYRSAEISGRWNSYIEDVKSMPGVVVTETGHKDGHRFINGLKDPLAANPATLLSDYDFDSNNIILNWKPYISLEKEFTIQRGVVKENNEDPSPEVNNKEFNKDRAYDLIELIEAHVFSFDKKIVELSPLQQLKYDSLKREINELTSLIVHPYDLLIHVNGHTNTDGNVELNEKFIDKRARQIQGYLIEDGIHDTVLEKNIYIYDKLDMPKGIKARSVNFKVDLKTINRNNHD